MMEEKARLLRYIGRSAKGGKGMRKICSVLLALILLFSSALAEDLTGMKVLYMEDRALTEGGAVMEYTKE